MKTLIKTLAVTAGIAIALKTRVIIIKRKDEPEPTVFKPVNPHERSEDLPRWNELTEEEQKRFSRSLNKVITGGTDIYAPLRVLRNIQKERKNQNG